MGHGASVDRGEHRGCVAGANGTLPVRPVRGDLRAEVMLGDEVAVEDEHVVVGREIEQPARVTQRATGAERMLLTAVAQPDAVRVAVTQRRTKGVRVVRGREHDGFDARRRETMKLVRDDGFVTDRQQVLRRAARERQQPGAVPTGQDDGVQAHRPLVLDALDELVLDAPDPSPCCWICGASQFQKIGPDSLVKCSPSA